MPNARFVPRWPSAVRFLIRSKNSPPGSDSAPNADQPAAVKEWRAEPKNFRLRRTVAHSRQLWTPLRITCRTHPGASRPGAHHTFHPQPLLLDQSRRSPALPRRRTRSTAPMPPYPQPAPPLLLLPEFIPGSLLKEHPWGSPETARCAAGPTPPDRLASRIVSVWSFSFQDARAGFTVGSRPPLR